MSGEADRDAEAFIRKWRARRGGSAQSLAESYMRGAAIDARGYTQLPDDPSKTEIHVLVDGRGLSAAADPGAIDEMVAEWTAMLADVPDHDHRNFTKSVIVDSVADNLHTDRPEIISAVVWLASFNPDVLAALRAGDVALTCDFTFDESRPGIRRMQMALNFAAPHGNG